MRDDISALLVANLAALADLDALLDRVAATRHELQELLQAENDFLAVGNKAKADA